MGVDVSPNYIFNVVDIFKQWKGPNFDVPKIEVDKAHYLHSFLVCLLGFTLFTTMNGNLQGYFMMAF